MSYPRGKNPNSRNGFKKGHKLNLGNQFAKGHKRPPEVLEAFIKRIKGNTYRKGIPSYNKGKKLHYQVWNTGKKWPELTGLNHPKWKGKEVQYRALHSWVERMIGKPNNCSHCGKIGYGRQMHWANKSHEYKRDLSDWLRLCPKCHKNYDKNLTLV